MGVITYTHGTPNCHNSKHNEQASSIISNHWKSLEINVSMNTHPADHSWINIIGIRKVAPWACCSTTTAQHRYTVEAHKIWIVLHNKPMRCEMTRPCTDRSLTSRSETIPTCAQFQVTPYKWPRLMCTHDQYEITIVTVIATHKQCVYHGSTCHVAPSCATSSEHAHRNAETGIRYVTMREGIHLDRSYLTTSNWLVSCMRAARALQRDCRSSTPRKAALHSFHRVQIAA